MTSTEYDESELVAALTARDESAFATLVDRYTPAMLRVARGYVRSTEAAEDVVQETWIALIKGIDKFEGRSSLRTWLFTVMINIAKSRGIRDRRTTDAELTAAGATVDPQRFRPATDNEWPGHWKDDRAPCPFPDTPEGSVLSAEFLELTREELDRLPERQRTVVTLRDVLGFESHEVCDLLGISVANQRVLLHRGRAAIRQALETYMTGVS
ncbi:RNA polymerase sigma factor [Mycobacterium sp. EPa45]|uniref:RNA polymerase sigma factor n=1 Tax=Mycobacterium sp. EPa45 TaxID=1545728 RepID=UPI0006425375|nr:RNA polymerase sigma factor [Mycobacterium sp. EPa45]AKK26074.1 RNA polymerase sigma24 factor [Mycobacterium sp. EPa45]